jgi:lipopolysaccharide export system permease protein
MKKQKEADIVFYPEMPARGFSGIIFFYVFRDAFFSFLVCFLFFFFIFFINQILYIAQQLLARSVPLNTVMLLVFYSLPIVVAMSAPFAALTGTLMTVGRLSSDNEVLVMLSSGLPYRVIFVPAIILGIIVSILSFITNDILLPAGTVQYNRVWRQTVLSTPELELESNSVKRFKNTILVCGTVSGASIDNLLILDRTGDGERRMIIAKKGELKDGGRQGLSLDLQQAFILSSKETARRDYDYASTGSLEYWVPQEDIMQSVLTISASEMTSFDVYREILTREADLQQRLMLQYARVEGAGLELEATLSSGPGASAWNSRSSQNDALTRALVSAESIKNSRSVKQYWSEFYRKFSMPVSAFCFIFLALPLGMMAKKSGQTMGFFFGLIIAVLYWAMAIIGQTLVQRLGYPPFWCIWLPNMLIFAFGLSLCILRIRR